MKTYIYLLILFLSGIFMVPTIAQINCDLPVDNYPWLKDILDANNCCQNQKVYAYPSGSYTFIYIQKCLGSGPNELYFQDGTYYCSDNILGGCRTAYGLLESNKIEVWDCSNPCGGNVDAVFSICRGESVLLNAEQEFPTPPIGPQGPDGSSPVFPCTPQLVSIEISPTTDALAVGTTGFKVSPTANTIYRVRSIGYCGPLGPGDITASQHDTIDLYYEVLIDCSGNGSAAAIFEEYPWLLELVDPSNCISEKVEVYEGGGYTYFLVTNASGITKLYNDSGQFYCQSSPTYDCIGLYNLGDPIDTWTCQQSTINCPLVYSPVCGTDGRTYGNGCVTIAAGTEVGYFGECTESLSPCEQFFGRVVETLCGTFIQVPISAGQPLGPPVNLFEMSLPTSAIQPTIGDSVKFSFISTGIETEACLPVDNTYVTGSINCIEIISESNGEAIFRDFPWLTFLIDPDNCTIGRIEVYEFGSGHLIRVQADDGFAKLYNQDGLFYCQESAANNCVEIYNLGAPIDSWTCPSNNQGCFQNTFTTGTFIPNPCEAGEPFFLVTDEGRIFEPYFTNIDHFPLSGQYVRFEYYAIRTPTYCSISDQAIAISCIEVLGSPPTLTSDCNKATGVLEKGTCDDGSTAYYVQVSPYDKWLIYPTDGLEFDFVDGLSVQFDWVDAPFPNPCSKANAVKFITCMQVLENGSDVILKNLEISEAQCVAGGNFIIYISTSFPIIEMVNPVPNYRFYSEEGSPYVFEERLSRFGGLTLSFDTSLAEELVILIEDVDNPAFRARVVRKIPNCDISVFESYPFLDSEIATFGCNAIEIFDQGSYSFVFLRLDTNRGRMYLDDGTFYCESTPTYDCLAAYGLGSPTSRISCSSFNMEESKERTGTSSASLAFKAFPNPTNGSVTLQLPASSTSDYELYIYDMLGRRMYHNKVNQTATSIEVDMENYENGVYHIELRASEIRGIQRVVKQ